MNPFTLNLPSELQIGVEKMVRLSAIERGEFALAVEGVEPVLGEVAFTGQIEPKLEKLSKEDLRSMVWTVFQLQTGSDALGMPPHRFAELVVESLEVADEDKPAGFAQWLGAILEARSVVLSAKAMNVFLDHDHTYSEARILTDIRAVWQDDVQSDPEVGVVYHLLKLIYWEGRSTRQMFVAMDSNDLRSLKDSIERAQSKERSLQRWLSQKEFALLAAPNSVEEESSL